MYSHLDLALAEVFPKRFAELGLALYEHVSQGLKVLDASFIGRVYPIVEIATEISDDRGDLCLRVDSLFRGLGLPRGLSP